MKFILFLAITSLFIGCQPIFTPTQQTDTTPKTKIIKKKIVSDMLRGVIETQYFDKNTNSWRYKLKVIDIASEHLNTFSFNFPRKLYDVGDLIYIILDKKTKKEVHNLYLIKKNYANKNKNEQNPKIKHKRTKERKALKIGIPKSETIKLN